MLALALDDTPGPSATPPPTIVTTKSSPLCKAMREIVAPVLVAVGDQDVGLGVSGAMLYGGNQITVMRLENNIDRLAQLNIQTNQLLDKLVTLGLQDGAERREVSAFERHLRGIAKLQNDALNQLSGTAYSNDLSGLEGFSNPMAGESQLRWQATNGAPAFSVPTGPSMEEVAARNLRTLRREIGAQESDVVQTLLPLVKRCV